ncbi:DUF3592 domain-containing protein [Streptomyces sp. NPDC005485]|uniref:DUF3592 domain-containing protein n=1 Tax=Streptomyces sp. NPDC005485 TaxID=3155591 RepID=UPI0033B91290
MELFFYLVPILMIAGVLFGAGRLLLRAQRIRSAWNSGLTAPARCLRTYTTTSGGGGDTSVSTTLHHVYEFATREGRTVRFEETNGPGTILEGDTVTAYYVAERPEQATAHAPGAGKLWAGTGCFLVIACVIVVFCVGFMVAVHGMFAESGGLLP